MESQFINAWAAGDATTRAFLTEVAIWVDANLVADPELRGIPWSEPNSCIAIVPTRFTSARVSVTYQLLADDRQVRIVRLLIRGRTSEEGA